MCAENIFKRDLFLRNPFVMKLLNTLLCLLLALTGFSESRNEIVSPGGKIKVTVAINNGVGYSVNFEDKPLVAFSTINIHLHNGTSLSGKLQVKKISRRSNSSVIVSPVPEKRKLIPDNYNELTILLQNRISVIFRVYDDGVAYRLVTHFKDSIVVNREIAEFQFPENYNVYFTQVAKRDNADIFHTSFEEPYELKTVDSLDSKNLCFSPLLVAPSDGPKMVLTESDLDDYPGMFLSGNGDRSLRASFAPFPLEEKITEGEFPQAIVTRRAGYIAKTKGSRLFPWRVILIAAADKELPQNDLVYRLASPSRVRDVSWIHPGQGTDEWIIGINLFNIPFQAGINTATYKYYIDFARRFGFERIMMDAGWSDYKDLFKINPNIDMEEISAYARKQGVRLSMWTLALTLDKQLDRALEQFNRWGVDFIMTDFMDRDDQLMVNFYHRIAEACAKHKIMIMYHGAFKPAGFNRTWPHAVTREAVLGSEYNIWSAKATPEHDLLLPFIRMTAGPMDYEPGILDNATEKTFRPISEKVMSMGTRCHQAAMFVVYDSPIQIFSGNPSQGLLEPDFMNLLGSIPTVWDTTIVIDGKLGDYLVTARRKGTDWYIGAMTDWTARQISIDLSFLEDGPYQATICEDGVNADRYPSDYLLRNLPVSRQEKFLIKMARGGGFVMKITGK